MVGQHVDDDVDPGAVEAPRLEREPLDPEMAARVAVDAEHGGMSGPPMAPPERDAGAVDREGGLGEDRHERALEPQPDEVAVHEPPEAPFRRAQRSRRREEGARVVDEAPIGIELAGARQPFTKLRARRRRKALPAEVAVEDEPIEPCTRAEEQGLESRDGRQGRKGGVGTHGHGGLL